MSDVLRNHVGGAWVAGGGPGLRLTDPITGQELARVSAEGLDLKAAFAFSRGQGGPALRAMGYARRAEALAAISTHLKTRRDEWYDIATANSGTTRADSAIDIDGAFFTLDFFARAGRGLGGGQALREGARTRLGRDEAFQSAHLLVPARGVALLINAFNFPSWGLWEKAAPALLSGVPVVVKPATATAWLTQRMVEEVVEAGLLPAGALSVVCGGSAGLLDALEPGDLLSFTGSAETAAQLRAHPAVAARSVRVNVEADSLNAAVLMPDAAPGTEAFDLFVKEVAREMTVKAGQKCTAIRRALVPRAHFAAVADALSARLAKTTVGDPRNETVRMGALASRTQLDAVRQGIELLATEARVLHDGRQAALVDADPSVAACIGPVLLGIDDPVAARRVHDTEVFGPVSTLMPYDDAAQAAYLVRRGEGSLVTSLFGTDAVPLADMVLELADMNGRLHVVTPEVAASQTGHGNVMPQSLHGGPGRAGGGEELGGLRALGFWHRRVAVQAGAAVLDAVEARSTPWQV